MIRAGLVGRGLAGRAFHGPLLRASADFELVAQIGSDGDLDALIEAVELVVVATPNRTHAAIAHRALAAGRHVVVDKPLATDADDAAALVEQAGGRLTVFQNRRWDGDFLTVRERLPELGRSVRFESRFERFRPDTPPRGWKRDPAEGGALLDFGAHLVDQALVLFGPVAALYGEVRSVRDPAGPDDDDFLALRHTCGVISHLWMGHVAPLHGPRFRVSGLAGGFAVDGLDPQEAQLESGMAPDAPGYGLDPARPGLLAGDYPAFYRGVAAWMRGGAPPPVDPRDAVAVLRVLDEAR